MLALNPWTILAGVVGSAVLIGCVGYQSYRLGQDSVIARQAREDQIRFETLQLAQQAAAEEIAKIEVKNVTIRQKLETEIREKPVYRDCESSEEILRLTNEAITGVSTEQSSHSEHSDQ